MKSSPHVRLLFATPGFGLSPLLVLAFAITGNVCAQFQTEPSDAHATRQELSLLFVPDGTFCEPLSEFSLHNSSPARKTENEFRAVSGLWDVNDENAMYMRQELARQVAMQAQRERVFSVFTAILENDQSTLRKLVMEEGVSPDSPLPANPPEEFIAELPTPRLKYYATRESNFTPLMFAAALGNREAAQILLEAGASRWTKTTRHRTYALWLAAKNNDLPMMRLLMNLQPGGEWERYEVFVKLADQKLEVHESGEIVFESRISSGKKAKPTPSGEYLVTDKHREWTSSLYHVKMPHFLRLSCSEIGFHAGRVPGYPASSGCIRLPPEKARELFELIPIGTYVRIE